jgi:hypothetical protein
MRYKLQEQRGDNWVAVTTYTDDECKAFEQGTNRWRRLGTSLRLINDTGEIVCQWRGKH